MSKSDEDSDRFKPTQTHPILELTKRTDKIPAGFVCPFCGHLAVNEDEIIGMTCPKCLQQWLVTQDVQQMVPISEMTDEKDSALVPTVQVPSDPIKKNPSEEETRIMKRLEDITLEKALEKKKKTPSDDCIPGL